MSKEPLIAEIGEPTAVQDIDGKRAWETSRLEEVARRYDFRLTPYIKTLLRGRPADDPLARQFLPDERELHSISYEAADPIGDIPFSPVKGVVHRYPDRVLLKVAHACPVYCRFCFRREMVGSNGEPLHGEGVDVAIDYIR